MDHHISSHAQTRAIVLLVDGQEDMRALYALALSAMGFDIVVADNGADARRRALEHRPDIIVVYLTEAGGDRWQLLHDLNEDALTRDIPVVALSDDGFDGMRERAACDGVVALLKPCPPDQLAAVLRRLLDAIQ
jgi:CheY-like chemotaxis protein